MFWRIVELIVGASRLMIGITFFIMSILQFFALIGGFQVWLGLHWIIAVPLAFITAGIPVVGTIIGMCGAVYAWDWTWVSAFLLFCGPFIVVLTIAGIATLLEKSR